MRINYNDESGQSKQITRIAYGADKAKQMEMQLLEKIKIKQEIPIKKMTVQELFEEYMQSKTYEIRKRTILKIQHIFDRYILPTYKNYRIDKITVRDVQSWKISMDKRNLCLRTKQSVFIYFSAMINYAVKMEYLHKNPFIKIGNFKSAFTMKAKMNFYTAEEFNKFIAVAFQIAEESEEQKNDLSEWNYYVFFNIAFYTGLRKGEIHALKWSDIDGAYLTVSRSLFQRLKNGEEETAPKNPSSMRTLQMPLPLIKILDKQRKRQQLAHNFTDDFRICNSIKDTSIQRKNQIYSTNAGLKTIRIHDFRHSHASVLANANINIQELARRLGHTRIDMTLNTYCHLYPKEEEKAVAILNCFTG